MAGDLIFNRVAGHLPGYLVFDPQVYAAALARGPQPRGLAGVEHGTAGLGAGPRGQGLVGVEYGLAALATGPRGQGLIAAEIGAAGFGPGPRGRGLAGVEYGTAGFGAGPRGQGLIAAEIGAAGFGPGPRGRGLAGALLEVGAAAWGQGPQARGLTAADNSTAQFTTGPQPRGLAGAERGAAELCEGPAAAGMAAREVGEALLAVAVRPVAAVEATFDPAVYRGPALSIEGHTRSGVRRAAIVAGQWRDLPAVAAATGAAFGQGPRAGTGARGAWRDLPAQSHQMAGRWRQGLRAVARDDLAARFARRKDRRETSTTWRQGPAHRAGYVSAWRWLPTRQGAWALLDRAGLPAGLPVVASLKWGVRIPKSEFLRWAAGRLLAPGRTPRPPEPPEPPPFVGDGELLFWELARAGHVIFNRAGDWRRIPIQRIYLMLHDIALTRYPGGEDVPATRFTLSLDADAWAWQFLAELTGPYARAAIEPDEPDSPVILQAEVNGETWLAIVDEWKETESHGRRSVSVQGRSLSAELGLPWVLPSSGTSTQARVAQQLAAEQLPNGWTLDWAMPDWLVPAGAWNWDRQTPMSAIQTLANAAGGIVVPAQDARVLRVQQRYPVLPWEFEAAPYDRAIPEAAILSLGLRSTPDPQANAIYVHGGSVGGILGRVLLAGTAGDRTAPTVQDDLITHVDAARGRGARELARQYRQPAIRELTLPMGDGFPLARLGDLWLVERGAIEHRGIVNGVALTVDVGRGVSVRQAVTLGEETPNAWAKFSALTAPAPLLVGTITATHGGQDGTVTVELPGGGTTRARGTGTVGQAVYVRGGRIEGVAPSLSTETIEV